MQEGYVARVLDLIDPSSQRLYAGMTVDEAVAILASEDPSRVREIEGSFALAARVDERVILARSLDRTLRYFLAKEESGPMLIVAERIDEIQRQLEELGYADQFHPSYTRMAPAHHTVTLRLIGCPDPNPRYQRFFTPEREVLGTDLDAIGERYVGALRAEVHKWLDTVGGSEPLGVCFSGGIDSGAVLIAAYRALLERGQSPARLKAFTLSVGDGGADAAQAREFLRRCDLEMLGEEIQVASERLAPLRAVEVIEDYKPLDVECATVLLALLEGIRERYPQWRLLLDGDGGDENLKDYPIEDNSELTIRSVVNNLMLYQEGWGVDSIKHSLTYSGGLSRGTVRTLAPARRLGFEGFSPFTRPALVEVAEGIDFAALTQGSHDKLYSLKGEVVRRGMRSVYGLDFPVFEKRRFQHGAMSGGVPGEVFDVDPELYRRHFLARF
ncbi:MAG: asparagine synthetase B family protein [Acidobacteria bacterium]|nr:MAG: asparagine synthetase B family protein [Acidobacteriota bacterium]